MKPILAAAALALTASAADAAIIQYSVTSEMTLDYARRDVGNDGNWVDISDEYPSTYNAGFALFEIDTSTFDGTAFTIDSLTHPDNLPLGVIGVWQGTPIWSISASFDADLNLTSLNASFDESAYYEHIFTLDAAQYFSLTFPVGDTYEEWQYTGDTTVVREVIDAPAPVPLPASAILLLSGIAGAGAIKLRRRS